VHPSQATKYSRTSLCLFPDSPTKHHMILQLLPRLRRLDLIVSRWYKLHQLWTTLLLHLLVLLKAILIHVHLVVYSSSNHYFQ